MCMGYLLLVKLAHGEIELPPSLAHNEGMFLCVSSGFKGAVMSRLCHHDTLCAGVSLPMRDCLLRPFPV